MEVNVIDDDADVLLQNMFEQLGGLSLSEEAAFGETADPWNINAFLQPLPSQLQPQAPPPQQAPEYHPVTLYRQDQSVQIGSNKRTIAVDQQPQQLFSSNLDQCETSTSINPSLQHGRSPSQAIFTVPLESIQFKRPVVSSVDHASAAGPNQQRPRKRQRR